MKVNESTLDNLIVEVSSFNKKLENYEEFYRVKSQLESENKRLNEKIRELEWKLNSPEWKARDERAKELDTRESDLKSTEQLAYNKGYAAAYVEVTSKMGAKI